MQTFEWIDATSVAQAVTLLGEDGVIAKAGGMDLLDLMKEGIVAPKRIVNLNLIDTLRGVRFAPSEGLRLGALTTLAEIAVHPAINEHYSALAQSAAHAATPQVRNAATIGGNLLQRPRCWYFRNRQFHQQGTDAVQLQDREHQYHAIFDNATTAMVHASTLATALIAYGAVVHLTGPNGRERSILLKDFLVSPSMTADRDADMAPDEVLTHISIPAPLAGARALYHKQTERDSYDWPIFDAAVVATKAQVIDSISIVIGSVAPTPMRAQVSESIIKGHAMSEALAKEAAQAAVRTATPFERNAYKVPMLEAVLRRMLLTVGA